MKKKWLLSVAWALLVLSCYGQNIAINADGSIPDRNAILDIKSTSKGLLIPRMTTESRMRIPNTKGMIVYDTSTDNFWYNDGKEWKCIPNNDDSGRNGPAWSITGNSNIKDKVNFLGTTNDVPLNIRVNNQPSGRIDSVSGSAFWGYGAGSNNNGADNTAVGYQALHKSKIGERNVAIGTNALNNTDSSLGNVAIGFNTMTSNTTGGGNTAIGYYALAGNTTATSNTAIGIDALLQNSGVNNTATGSISLVDNTTGHDNTASGEASLSSNTSGIFNAAFGNRALRTNLTGSDLTGIGSFADVSTDGLSNATAIGAGAIVDASNKVRIGNSAVTIIEGQVPFTTPSDGRFKFNIQEDVKGLEFIMHLRPVTYQFDVRRFDAGLSHQEAATVSYAVRTAYDEATRIRRSGFIAQEVEQAANLSGYNFSGLIKPKTEQDHYSLSYDAFVVPLVKGMQEQQLIIETQNKKLAEQDKRIASLEQAVGELKKLIRQNK